MVLRGSDLPPRPSGVARYSAWAGALRTCQGLGNLQACRRCLLRLLLWRVEIVRCTTRFRPFPYIRRRVHPTCSLCVWAWTFFFSALSASLLVHCAVFCRHRSSFLLHLLLTSVDPRLAYSYLYSLICSHTSGSHMYSPYKDLFNGLRDHFFPRHCP